MIKIAVPKGRIEKEFCEKLTKSGFDTNPIINKKRKLLIKTKDEIEIMFVKAEDVMTYLEFGIIDIGIVGKDTILESDYLDYEELLDLEIGKCKFCLASYPGYKAKQIGRKQVIATKYPKITNKFFSERNEAIKIIKLNGSVELGPVVKMTDAIVDIVETGNTLRENGLEVIEEICDISTKLIARKRREKSKNEEIIKFVESLERGERIC